MGIEISNNHKYRDKRININKIQKENKIKQT